MPNDTPRSIPRVKVTIDGTDLPPEVQHDLTAFEVHDDLDVPSMFSLQFVAWRDRKITDAWVDDDRLALGGEVEISIGYDDAIKPIFKGEITGLELELEGGEVPVLLVRGYDRGHRLLRGHKTQSFVQMKDSDIASKIASDQGLSADAVDSGVKHAYVLQHAQSDFEFLRGRAEAIGYEMVVEDKTLHFRPRRTNEAKPLALAEDNDLLAFFPRMTARNQVGLVEVRGWDPKEKKAILGKAKAGDDALTAEDAGAKLSDKAFGDSVLSYVRHPISTQEEADQYALKQLEEVGAAFVKAEGLCMGRNDLRAGSILDIQGVGKRFGGAYHVTSAIHSYVAKMGYRTRFAATKEAK